MDEISASVRNRRIALYFRRYLRWFLVGGVFLLATNYLALEIPAHVGRAIEGMQEKNSLESIRTHALWIIALAIGAGIARILSRVFIFNAGRLVEFDLRNQLYEHLARLETSWFGKMSTGDITSRVSNDVNFVRLLYAIAYLHVINTVVAYILALNKMIALDWRLTIFCLIPYPIIFLAVRFIIQRLFLQTKVVQTELSKISSRVQENLTGIQVVKTYTLEEREVSRFKLLNDNFVEENIRLVTLRGGLQATMTLLSGAGTLVILIVGASWVVDGTLSIGQFVEFNGYVVALAFPTMGLGWVLAVWNRGIAAFDRILEVLETQPTIDSPAVPTPLPNSKALGHIRFENVNFSYGDVPALTDINLDIPAGSKVAIVGRTGSGKSTLVSLIARLYDPTSGEIRIDGIPLREVDLRKLRAEIGVVPQDPFLFSMTIGDNVRFGLDAQISDPTIDRGLSSMESPAAATKEALAIAGLESDLKSFPKGIETEVGERGITLSGGQKQRVTIARALVIDPRILILDDALSSVDNQTEQIILDHLKRIMKDRTTVMVTHRFSALSQVDTIFVMDEGRIVESGSHAVLLEKGGVYSELHEHQRLREQLEQ